jgi:cation diffusion facilitator CzcD-associated flavoprotein CzcO
MAATKEMSTGEDGLHGVLIVGGGICGLATALALHMYDPFTK